MFWSLEKQILLLLMDYYISPLSIIKFSNVRELGDSSFKKYKFYYLEWKNNIVILWYMELMTNITINLGLIDLDLNQTSEFLYVKKDNS